MELGTTLNVLIDTLVGIEVIQDTTNRLTILKSLVNSKPVVNMLLEQTILIALNSYFYSLVVKCHSMSINYFDDSM